MNYDDEEKDFGLMADDGLVGDDIDEDFDGNLADESLENPEDYDSEDPEDRYH